MSYKRIFGGSDNQPEQQSGGTNAKYKPLFAGKTSVAPVEIKTPAVSVPQNEPRLSAAPATIAKTKPADTWWQTVAKAVLPHSLEVKFGLSEPTLVDQMKQTEEENLKYLQPKLAQIKYEDYKSNPNNIENNAFVGILKDTFIPTKALQAWDSAGVNAAKQRINAEWAQEHPVASIVPVAIGTLLNLIILRQAGAGFNIESNVAKSAGGLGNLYPTATRIIGSGLETGSIFGIQSFISEALSQAQSKEVNPKKLATETIRGEASGMVLGGAGALPTLAARTAAGAGVMGGLSALEGFIQDKKIDSKDLTNIAINTIIGAGFELLGGNQKTELFRAKEIRNIATEKTVNLIMQNKNISREEAEKLAGLMDWLSTNTKVVMQEQAPEEVLKGFESMPKDFWTKSTQEKYQIFSKVVDEVNTGKTIPEAIQTATTSIIPPITARENVAKEKTNPNVNIVELKKNQTALDEYNKTFSTSVIDITKQDGRNLASMKVVKYGNQQWGYSYEINTASNTMTADFNSNDIFKTRKAAIAQAQKEILAYATKEASDRSVADQKDLNAVAEHVKKIDPANAIPIDVLEKLATERPTVVAPIKLSEEDNTPQTKLEVETLTSLELAEAGYRYSTKDELGYDEWHGVKSSFPDWIPAGLRSKSVITATLKHIQEGTLPTKVKEVELYNAIAERLGFMDVSEYGDLNLEQLDEEIIKINNEIQIYEQELKEASANEDYESPSEVGGPQQAETGKTQKQLVEEAVKEKPKTIKEVSEETKILEPNVRRILGVGAKDGTFERVDKGVYILKKDGKELAYIETGDAIEVLPRLAKEGLKVDMVFLDIPYKTPAVIGGNRGIKYDYITPEQFKIIVDAVKDIVRDEETPIFYMYSQARSGEKAMQKYTDIITETFSPVARGEYTKLQQDGITRVRNMRGNVIEPEGIILLTKSGNFQDFEIEKIKKAQEDLKSSNNEKYKSEVKDWIDQKISKLNLNFKLIRPKGYQTEKPAEMIKAMIEMSTKEGDVIIDPFAGSGVVPATAVRFGRRAVAIEKSEKAVEEYIKPRIEEATKKSILYHGTNKEAAAKIKELGLNPSTGETATYGKGIYLTPDINVAKDYAKESAIARKEKDGEVIEVIAKKELNLYTPTYDERADLVDLIGPEQEAYIKKLLGDKYEGFLITDRAGGKEVVIYDQSLIEVLTKKEKSTGNNYQSIEEENYNNTVENEQELIQKYEDTFGNFLGGDNIKELFPGYTENRSNYLAYRKASDYLWNKIFDKWLKDKQDVATNEVLFLTGAPGVGKTTSVKTVMGEEYQKNYSFIVETTGHDKALFIDKTMKRVLDNDFGIEVIQMLSDIDASFERTLKRAQSNEGLNDGKGRVVYIPDYVERFIGAVEIGKELSQKYSGINKEIRYRLIMNTGKKGEAYFVQPEAEFDVLSKADYNKEKDNLIKKFYGKTIQVFNSGEISQNVYEGATGLSGGTKEKSFAEREIGIARIKQGSAGQQSIKKSRFAKEPTNQGSIFGFNPKNLEDLESPSAIKETDKIIKRSEIAKKLSEKLNVPIRRGKFRARGALGIFKTQQKVVRVKKGGLATIFHEVGHFLDDQFAFSEIIDVKERKALMVEYGLTYEGQPIRQRQEAFAEFLRWRMTGQKSKADLAAPKFSLVFDQRMNELPEIKEVIDTATADYSRWQEQPAVAKVLSQISIGAQKENSNLKDRVLNGLHNLYTMAKDDLHPLAEFSGVAKRELGSVPMAKDPYILARNLRGWVGKANTFLEKGTFGKDYWKIENGKTVAVFKGKSFTDIIKPVEEAKKTDELRAYLVAQRAIELAKRSIISGISRADAETVIKELSERNPEFEQVAQDLYKYQDDLLNYAAENGLIGEKGLEKIKALNKLRVPFYRVMEESQVAFMGKKKMAGNLSKPIKKIKGSEREIIDPLESIIKDTYAIINSAERNAVGIAMANLANENYELGRLFEKVDAPMAPTTVNVGEVLEKSLIGQMVPDFANIIPDEVAEEMVTLFRPMQDRGPNMLNVNMGDKQLVFQVDPDLFKAIQGLNTEDIGTIMRIISMPAKLLRAGATLSPDFAVRNPARDQFTAFIYSKYGFIPGLDLFKGMFELFKKGDVYDLWRMGGGGNSMLVSMDRDYLQSTFKDLVRTKGGTFFKYVKNPVELLRTLSEIGEEGTRLGEMKRALDAQANPIEGAYSSREVTLDFARIGAKTKAINAIIAFWNANVEGMDRTVRSFKDNPLRTLFKLLISITLPSILLYFANRGDKRWKEIPAWQKDLFWIVMTKDHIYRIPKPFELGIMFGSVPERILEYLDNSDPELFTNIFTSIVDGATPGFIPTALAPIIENITNYSFFLGRPIVPQGKESLPGKAQYGTYTTEIAKLIGKVLDYSPSKIDNLIQGYSGGLGRYATDGIDKVLKGTGVVHVPQAPAAIFEDYPILKAFTIRPPIGSASESVNKVYTLYQQTSGEMSYIKDLADNGNIEYAQKLFAENPNLQFAHTFSGVVQSFSDINNAKDEVRKSELSPADKQKRISELDTLETDIAQRVLEQIKAAK